MQAKSLLQKVASLHLGLYTKFFHTAEWHVRREVNNAKAVLDLGCGRNTCQTSNNEFTVGVELFKPYLKEAKANRTYSEHVLADARKLCFKPKSFDVVIAVELIEHLEKDESRKLLQHMERIAKKKIVITTPNGYLLQWEDENKYQVHKCGWTIEELLERGFKVKGLRGLKILWRVPTLRGYLTAAEFEQRVNRNIVSGITQKITYHFPKHAFSLLCIKEL